MYLSVCIFTLGRRLKGYDVKHAGVATHFVTSEMVIIFCVSIRNHVVTQQGHDLSIDLRNKCCASHCMQNNIDHQSFLSVNINVMFYFIHINLEANRTGVQFT